MTATPAQGGLLSLTGRQWLILLMVQLSNMLFGMTITLANLVLPQVRGTFSATQDEIAWVVTLNLVFLMTIVALPATNGLYGAYRHNGPVAILYFSHMTLIASLNMLLWYIALGRDARGRPFLAALVPVTLGIAAVILANINPDYAPYPMLLAFAAPLVTWRWTKAEETLPAKDES